jgi:hypothetical protein
MMPNELRDMLVWTLLCTLASGAASAAFVVWFLVGRRNAPFAPRPSYIRVVDRTSEPNEPKREFKQFGIKPGGWSKL